MASKKPQTIETSSVVHCRLFVFPSELYGAYDMCCDMIKFFLFVHDDLKRDEAVKDPANANNSGWGLLWRGNMTLSG
jgi:hypothetical protein